MAAVATLVDDFDDNVRDTTKWPSTLGTVAETGGVLTAFGTSSSPSGYYSAATYSLAGSSIFLKLTPPTTTGTATSVRASCQLSISGLQILEFWADKKANATGFSWTDFFTPANNFTSTVTYNATAHQWLKLRESSGTLFLDGSPSGLTWTNLLSHATPTALASATTIAVRVGQTGTGAHTESSIIDNVNVAPASPARTTDFMPFFFQ